MATKQQTPRRYTNTRRAAQAAQTRADVLAAAVALFGESGWAGTTIAGIAERAGVAVETVYSGFGSKKALLRAALDVAIAGDAEPIPYIEREEVRALATGSTVQRMEAGVRILTDIHVRSAHVWAAIMEAGAGDEEIARWRTELDGVRKIDVRRSLEMVLGEELDDVTLDLIWAMYGPEVFLKLTVEAGWTRDEYEQRILDASRRLLGR